MKSKRSNTRVAIAQHCSWSSWTFWQSTALQHSQKEDREISIRGNIVNSWGLRQHRLRGGSSQVLDNVCRGSRQLSFCENESQIFQMTFIRFALYALATWETLQQFQLSQFGMLPSPQFWKPQDSHLLHQPRLRRRNLWTQMSCKDSESVYTLTDWDPNFAHFVKSSPSFLLDSPSRSLVWWQLVSRAQISLTW